MRNRTALLLLLGALPGALAAQGDPVADSATPPPVESLPLDGPSPGAAGLLPARVTGLPGSLWLGSDPATLRALIGAVDPAVPAMQGLMRVLMLAEADPPAAGDDGVAHLAARIDWLVRHGAVDEAQALLEIAGHDVPVLFRRWADLALLQGRTEALCSERAARPQLSDDLALAIFCTARRGDWPGAALMLRSGAALGDLGPRESELLTRFLDPELAEGAPPLLPPVRPSPLEFRLFEALGEPLPTAPLPLAFSVLDLGGDNGWKAQLEAAERLARASALPANRLLGLYTLRRPAASGGVWERAAGLQRLERALARGAPDSAEAALQQLWPQMASAGLLVPLAELYAAPLAALALDGRAARQARLAVFLSPGYEALSAGPLPDTPDLRFLTAIARGETPAERADLPHAGAVAAAFGGAEPPDVLLRQLQDGRLGEVILRVQALFASGAEGNAPDLTDALATLRALGLEDVARRAALQIMILDAERARR